MHIEATINNGIVEEVYIDGVRGDMVNFGQCRQVFVVEIDSKTPLYIKFDNPTKHAGECGRQSTLEAKIAETICEKDKKFFCMPLAHGTIQDLGYVVQEEVRHENIPTDYDIEDLNKILERYQLIGDVGYTEYGAHNCVLTKEGWKIYDFALLD